MNYNEHGDCWNVCVCFRCAIEDKCICVCLIPALFSFVYVHGAIFPVVLMFVASSSPVEGWGRDNMVSERKLQQWASMGQEYAVTEGRITFSVQQSSKNFERIWLSMEQSGRWRSGRSQLRTNWWSSPFAVTDGEVIPHPMWESSDCRRREFV